MPRPIGGFLPLRLPTGAATPESALSQWTGEGDAWLLHNARSALHALWNKTRPRRVWLPAYVCPEVANAIPTGIDARYYPLDEALFPRVDFLSAQVFDGDHVLAIEYFGRPANAAFIAFAHARPEIGWVRDRAHGVDAPDSAWGDWLLYSPRKLVGVPDGGILVPRRKALWPLATTTLTDLSFVRPSLERFNDHEEIDNERWYANYVRQEAAMGIGLERMSRLTLELLKKSDARADGVVRRRNYRVLYEHLSEYAFFPDADLSFAPLGFPLRVKSAASLSMRLSEKRIFASRHWPSLPSDPATFAAEHHLAQQLVTLPCDYRYDEVDMQRVADGVLEAMTAGG